MNLDFTETTKDKIIDWGADLAGIADVSQLKGLETDPADLLDPFSRAISIAVQLPARIFEMIEDCPVPIYANIYQIANRLLDEIAFKTSCWIQNQGYLALPVPASQVLSMEKLTAAISHKAVARMAGLGWQGKNLLLITPKFGSRVRLVTVLTDAPLKVDGPVKNRCGKCSMCKDACPVSAIKGVNTKDHYKNRDEALYFSRCKEKLLNDFAKQPNIGAPICGICIKVCPFGRKKLPKKDS